MKAAEITFELLSYWHAGSGMGEGANLDAVVIKTPAGLPYIPGKTVKGLIREAFQTLADLKRGGVDDKLVEDLFGMPGGRFDSSPGQLAFTDATLGASWEAWAADNAGDRDLLLRKISSTSLEESGVAKQDTLRSIEVVIPLTLKARVEPWCADIRGEWLAKLELAKTIIRHVGSHRHRGLGRVRVGIMEVER